MSPFVHPFFDAATHSFSYVVVDPPSRKCAIIDPVLNYDRDTATASATAADAILEFVRANDLLVEWILETHVHADHISAARYLRSQLPSAQIAVSVGVLQVQRQCAARFELPVTCDGSQFDRLLHDDDRWQTALSPTPIAAAFHKSGSTPR